MIDVSQYPDEIETQEQKQDEDQNLKLIKEKELQKA